MTSGSVPEPLRAARRSLDSMSQISVNGDWHFHVSEEKWVLGVTLTHQKPPTAQVPSETSWRVLASGDYPEGPILIMPAANGMVSTFPHQRHNSPPQEGKDWRGGRLCVDELTFALDRAGHQPEPHLAHERLLWHLEQSIGWLESAATDNLSEPGQHFELPDFPTSSSEFLVFNESQSTFGAWVSQIEKSGTVTFSESTIVPNAFIAKSFTTRNQTEVLNISWGAALSAEPISEMCGAWLLLPSLPIVQPWQAPVTWGELRSALTEVGTNLDSLMRPIFRALRDGTSHILLLGFPIPETFGDDPVQIHWQPLRLPAFPHAESRPRGFRPTEQGHWTYVSSRMIGNSSRIEWLGAQNWNGSERDSRGTFPREIQEQNVLLIGCGALGSSVAELLVRGGVKKLTLTDFDVVSAGNLSRHTLRLSDVGKSKSRQLAHSLNLANPQAQAQSKLGRVEKGDVTNFDLVIDTSGSDEVAYLLGAVKSKRDHRFVSLSMGLAAQRLFFFGSSGSFPSQEFIGWVRPLADEDNDKYRDMVQWEGIGCWHPVFPARADEVALLASAAVGRLLSFVTESDSKSDNAIIEVLKTKTGAFDGIRVS